MADMETSKSASKTGPKETEGPKSVNAGRIRRQRRAAILAAAEQEFAINGYKGTSTGSIAKRAGLAKAQLHYYFPAKEELYRELLGSVLEQWDCHLPGPETELAPAEVLRSYITAKLRLSWDRPELSKVFAGEVLRGAPVLKQYLIAGQRHWLDQREALFNRWIAEGKMLPIDPLQLVFMIWSVTQHYADYQTQVLLLMGQTSLTEQDFERISDQVVGIILRGCGIDESGGRGC
jgi:TetR/AcrR family transcriptional regulator